MEFRTFAEAQLAEEIRRLSTGGAIISAVDTDVSGKPCHAMPCTHKDDFKFFICIIWVLNVAVYLSTMYMIQ